MMRYLEKIKERENHAVLRYVYIIIVNGNVYMCAWVCGGGGGGGGVRL